MTVPPNSKFLSFVTPESNRVLVLSRKESPLNLTRGGGGGGKRNKGEGETGEIRRTEEENKTTECSGTYTVELHMCIRLIVGLTGDVHGPKTRGGGG